MIGSMLAHYRMESKLGEGGMGVVYRATDTHLDRPVAIKVLRSEAVADPERKRRFIQEAKAASALNHPNIITIHDISNAGGVDFIVMEYVKGQPLDQLIGRKGLGVSEALKYAVQIADALAKAHAAGLVHRDLKPGNVMVSEDGPVKVVDFGLAKLAETPESEASSATQTMTALREASPTRTEEGVIVGTVAYMSPEQAEGKKVDARSDIFSFGAVLYEMITGRKAFPGETKISTLTAVLHQEPKPLSPEGAPRELERIITWCLRKDPNRRLQHMDDAKIALEQLKEDTESGRLAAAESPLTRRPWLSARLVAGGVLLVVAATAGITWWLTRVHWAGKAVAPTLTRLTSDAGLTAHPALSRDGKLLAYASDRGGEGNLDIWVQQIGGGQPIRLTRHEADDSEPAFSPDGTKIAFRSEREGGGIYVVSALGGLEQRLADQGRTPRFSPDGKGVAYWVGDQSLFGRRRLFVVAATGGQPREPQSAFYSASYPLWAPDGKHLLFLGVTDPNAADREIFDWWVTPVEGGTAVRTEAYRLFQQHKISPLERDSGAWVGDFLFFSAGSGDSASLWRVSISSRTWRVNGNPLRVTSGTGLDLQPSAAVLEDGRIRAVFSSEISNADIWMLKVDSQGKASGEPQRLTTNTAADTYPFPSADGKRIAFASDRAGSSDIWVKDLESGNETALTATPFNESVPMLSPDGSAVVYTAFEGQKMALYVVSTRGAVARKLWDHSPGPIQHWSPDGKKLVYRKGLAGKSPIVMRTIDSGEEIVLLQHPKHSLTAARFSPDQRWLSFQTIIGPLQRQIFITPIRDGTPLEEKDWIPITDGSGLDRNAAWSPDGRVLYFLSERDGFRCVWAQRLEPSTNRPAGPPVDVYHFHQARRSLLSFQEVGRIGLSAAGDRIFFSIPETTGNIWMAELP